MSKYSELWCCSYAIWCRDGTRWENALHSVLLDLVLFVHTRLIIKSQVCYADYQNNREGFVTNFLKRRSKSIRCAIHLITSLLDSHHAWAQLPVFSSKKKNKRCICMIYSAIPPGGRCWWSVNITGKLHAFEHEQCSWQRPSCHFTRSSPFSMNCLSSPPQTHARTDTYRPGRPSVPSTPCAPSVFRRRSSCPFRKLQERMNTTKVMVPLATN